MNPEHGHPNHECQTWNWMLEEVYWAVHWDRTATLIAGFIAGLAVGVTVGWFLGLANVLGVL